MDGHPVQGDRRGGGDHYAVLGVAGAASAAEIKAAFRRRAKELHPDHNRGPGAAEAFQRLVGAYRVLGDAEARARYDALVSRRPGATAAPGGRSRVSVEPVTCCRCGVIPEQPRFVIYWWVLGYLVGTRRQAVQGVFCRTCADTRALRASLLTWLFGWWALPWAPVWSVAALWRNLRGGERPADINAAVLLQQARYFVVCGKRGLARSTLERALTLAQRPDLRQQLEKMSRAVGNVPRAPQIDHWQRAASPAYYLQLMLVIIGGVALVREIGVLVFAGVRLMR